MEKMVDKDRTIMVNGRGLHAEVGDYGVGRM